MNKWRGVVVGLVILASIALVAGFWVRMQPDVHIGELLAKNNCDVCHDLTHAKKTEKGPYLWGIVNRPAGTVDFPYSGPFMDRIRENPLVWTEENLERFVTNPVAIIPQIQMAQHTSEHPLAFEGMESPTNRRDLIAWLKTLH
ncbi:MAG: hypothetical protein HQL07_14835 [Nitrospirae bacterium]|nr:hypothetical protein [Magnetococcales bacterium]HAT49760.1 hypothetical protein [Alphaproteobacteria bacterium]